MNIPITKPCFGEEEKRAIIEPLESGWVVQGPKVKEFERLFAEYTGAKYAIAISNCTAALHLALVALGIDEGDEVIVPAFTWVSTANVVEYQRGKPVFVDIDLRTFNIDVKQIEDKITPRTKAIIPVHLFGLSADMDPIMEIAKRHNLYVVEDAACALGTFYKGRCIGTIGDATCFSFHPRKLITTGEGGMLTTNDPDIARQVSSRRDHGALASDLERHKAGAWSLPEFPWLGYNYRMTDLQGAIGVEQMKKLDWIIQRRIELAHRYDEMLSELEAIETPFVPDGYRHTYQSYVTLVKDDSPLSRDEIALRLQAEGIATRQGTQAVHALGYYKNKYGIAEEDYPMTWKAACQSLTLPLYPTMTEEEQDYVVEKLVGLFS